MSDDPVLDQLRKQISETDRAIVEAMNERLELVAQVKAHKAARGIGFPTPQESSGCSTT